MMMVQGGLRDTELGARPPRRVAIFATLLLFLPLFPGATQAEEAERPAWLRPLTDESESETEPEEEASDKNWGGWSKLEPGVLDVQAWDWLQMDLERLLFLTSAPAYERLSPNVFEQKYMGATTEFLEIDAEASETFRVAVGKALDELRIARTDMLQRSTNSERGVDATAAMLESRTHWTEYRKAQSHAARHALAVLRELPRHELLREAILKWLLRFEYGMQSAAK